MSDHDGIGVFLGLDDAMYVKYVVRPMMMDLMLQIKRELKVELTAQMRREMRAFLAHLKRDDATTTGDLVPLASIVADEHGRINCALRRRAFVFIEMPKQEDWLVAMRKFNKAD